MELLNYLLVSPAALISARTLRGMLTLQAASTPHPAPGALQIQHSGPGWYEVLLQALTVKCMCTTTKSGAPNSRAACIICAPRPAPRSPFGADPDTELTGHSMHMYVWTSMSNKLRASPTCSVILSWFSAVEFAEFSILSALSSGFSKTPRRRQSRFNSRCGPLPVRTTRLLETSSPLVAPCQSNEGQWSPKKGTLFGGSRGAEPRCSFTSQTRVIS